MPPARSPASASRRRAPALKRSRVARTSTASTLPPSHQRMGNTMGLAVQKRRLRHGPGASTIRTNLCPSGRSDAGICGPDLASPPCESSGSADSVRPRHDAAEPTGAAARSGLPATSRLTQPEGDRADRGATRRDASIRSGRLEDTGRRNTSQTFHWQGNSARTVPAPSARTKQDAKRTTVVTDRDSAQHRQIASIGRMRGLSYSPHRRRLHRPFGHDPHAILTAALVPLVLEEALVVRVAPPSPYPTCRHQNLSPKYDDS